MLNSLPERFTFPFCYTPHPMVVEAKNSLFGKIDSDPFLRGLFSEGKMIGTLLALDSSGSVVTLYAFSGLAGGRSLVEGFVPPIFDTAAPDSYFKKKEAEISALTRTLDSSSDGTLIRTRRKAMSEDLQNWLFSHYIVSNAKGESLSIKEIFERRGLVPPGGTGDCAAPKLLQYAYDHRLKPLAMGEFWYGSSKGGEVRTHGAFYPSCSGKCGPLLEFMMDGLEIDPNPLESDELWTYREPSIVYRDESIVVADKPSGMLCVPGRSSRESLKEYLSSLCGREVFEVHRLDMDTSGLVVFAFDPASQRNLRTAFEARKVEKRYSARLCAPSSFDESDSEIPSHGFIKLKLIEDWYDRPRRIVSTESGQLCVTEYNVLRRLPDGRIDIQFIPHTGRTHQLRVSAASSLGLGRPIEGDRLYGGGLGPLKLRSTFLSFSHPLDGRQMSFSL